MSIKFCSSYDPLGKEIATIGGGGNFFLRICSGKCFLKILLINQLAKNFGWSFYIRIDKERKSYSQKLQHQRELDV